MNWIRKYARSISILLCTNLLLEVLLPTLGYAITGRDKMPEYRSFEPVSTSNMVNLFDGSFTYNIPLLNVPNGTGISLSYHSNNITNEEQASWVGLGWTLNPGAVNRMKRGFPDEFKDKSVTYHNRMPANWTVSGGFGLQPEVFGDESLLNLNLGATAHYNNYNGIGYSSNVGLDFAGVANLNLVSQTPSRYGFKGEVNPLALMNLKQRIEARKARKTGDHIITSMDQLVQRIEGYDNPQFRFNVANGFPIRFELPNKYPTTLSDYNGGMFSVKVDGGVNWLPIPVSAEGSVHGSFNIQKNVEEQEKSVFGYEYNEMALADEEAMMDYFTEMDQPFEKRSNIMGYPVSNHDMYSMSGEAFGGTYRPWRADYGHFRIDKTRGQDFSADVGIDLKVASVVGIIPPLIVGNLEYSSGFSVGGAYHWTTVKGWENNGQAENYQFGPETDFPLSREKVFYNFSSDPAGHISYIDGDEAIQADLVASGLDAKTDMTSFTTANLDDHQDFRSLGKSKKRSTFVNHHKNSEWNPSLVSNKAGKQIHYRVHEKEARLVNIDAQGNPISFSNYDHFGYDQEATGEIVSYNPDGVTYVYGLPLYARNEKQLQYSLKPDADYDPAQLNGSGEGQLAIPYSGATIDHDAKRKLGFESEHEYPTTHLLTQMLDRDYLDRTADGPTTDDFGGYTKFSYSRLYGGNGGNASGWYSSRSPYQGLSFSFGSLSDNKDDMGSLSYFEKEVYYLNQIASKTHVAIFYVSDREDGISSKLDENHSADELIKGKQSSAAHKKLKKLDRIELYTLEDCKSMSASGQDIGLYKPKRITDGDAYNAKPIQTVHLKYDYSLSPDLPNNCANIPGCTASDPSVLNGESTNQGGKLTLKKVWFEYEGKITSKISPYEFGYHYAKSDYPTVYDALEDYGNFPNPPAAAVCDPSLPGFDPQNPCYSTLNSDRWGLYRSFDDLKNNLGDLSRFYPFVNQAPDPAKFDPAAYCLKQIKLPSGGEIHVQYEQNEYQFVQDQPAMAMVPLKKGAGFTAASETSVTDKKYYLDLDKVGIPLPATITDRQFLARQLFTPMRINKDRMFFNFLYALMGSNVDYRYTSTDFIEGYARIEGYGADANGIYFTFKGNPGGSFDAINYGSQASKREIPRTVCKDFYRSQRRGKIGVNGTNALDDAVDNDASVKDIVQGFVNLGNSIDASMNSKCMEMDPAMSYVRVQLPPSKAKLGGGVRVKRLLTYDSGTTTLSPDHLPTLYGNTYDYTAHLNPKDDSTPLISSGVATNEPSTGRRENALVKVIDKDPQTKASAILFGRDMYSQEAPLGESFLPAPAVGYSKVTVHSIHQGKTGTGSFVNEFYTCRDFPFKADKTIIDEHSHFPITIGASASGGDFGVSLSYSRRAPHLTQGYAFIQNAMHGREKRVAKFGQDMNDSPIEETIYTYFEPGDQVKVMGDDMAIQTIDFEDMGRSTELYSESREVGDYTVGGNVDIDITVPTWFTSVIPPFVPLPVPGPYATSVPTIGASYSEQILRTHVTTKVVNYPSLVKEAKVFKDGATHRTVNEYFDDNTGNAVVTRSFDDFKGAYRNQTFPASWEYSSTRSKYQNEGLVIDNTTPGVGAMLYQDNGNEHYIQFITAGAIGGLCDAMSLFAAGDFVEVGATAALFHVDELDYSSGKVMLIPSMLNSNPISSGVVGSVRIINSGYTNELNPSISNITFFKEDNNPAPFLGYSPQNTSHPFVMALNSQFGNIGPLGSNVSDVPLTLTGTFTGMDISAFTSYLPTGCVGTIDPQNATLTSVDIRYSVDLSTGQMTITVLGFDVAGCSGTITCVNPDNGGPGDDDPSMH